MMTNRKDATDQKLRQVRVDRQQIAAALKSRLHLMDYVTVAKSRSEELEHERQLFEQAYEVLMKPAALSPADRQLLKEEKEAARWLDDELELSE